MDQDNSFGVLRAENPRVVLDPYEWLPPYGESEVSFHAGGMELTVNIAYDDQDEASELPGMLAIRFDGVAAFYVSSVPGIELTRIRHSTPELAVSGSVVEFADSDAARAWQEALKHRPGRIKHYLMLFLSENKRLEVFAEDCQRVGPTAK